MRARGAKASFEGLVFFAGRRRPQKASAGSPTQRRSHARRRLVRRRRKGPLRHGAPEPLNRWPQSAERPSRVVEGTKAQVFVLGRSPRPKPKNARCARGHRRQRRRQARSARATRRTSQRPRKREGRGQGWVRAREQSVLRVLSSRTALSSKIWFSHACQSLPASFLFHCGPSAAVLATAKKHKNKKEKRRTAKRLKKEQAMA